MAEERLREFRELTMRITSVYEAGMQNSERRIGEVNCLHKRIAYVTLDNMTSGGYNLAFEKREGYLYARIQADFMDLDTGEDLSSARSLDPPRRRQL